jgi:hypothetical protein
MLAGICACGSNASPASTTLPSPSQSPTASVSPTPPPSPSLVSSSPSPAVRRQGILILAGNGTAYDIDSLAPNWAPLINHSWISQNIAYLPTGNNGKPLVLFAGSPYTDVVMSGKGPWSYQDCASAPYGVNHSTTGPNVITGPALEIGRGTCVETEDAPLTSNGGPKTDGKHYALLMVRGITSTTLALEITVWQ